MTDDLRGLIEEDSGHLSPLEKFDAGAPNVTAIRERVYGHPAVTFRRIQSLKEIVRECRDPEIREALEGICVKLARLIEAPGHIDSLVDIVGYARTAAMCLDRREKQMIPFDIDRTTLDWWGGGVRG